MRKSKVTRLIVENRRARYDYDVLERSEAGIVLLGSEVKSLRAGRVNLVDSFAIVREDGLFLIGAHISPYLPAGRANHDPNRPRQLLMHHREIRRLRGLVKRDSITLIALKLYFNEQGRVKLELAVGKGRRKSDKRAAIAKDDWRRRRERLLKTRS